MGKQYGKISMAVIRRLPKYHRYLRDLLDKDVNRISSKELSILTGFTASQIRQDLNCFGEFGQQGYGYNVEELFHEIRKIIGLTKTYNTIIVGYGNMGRAISKYTNFTKSGFTLRGIFDNDPAMIGKEAENITIQSVDELEAYLKNNKVDIAIISTPRDYAQEIATKLSNGGVSGIWNFAPVDLKVSSDISVENVHLSDSLYTLSYLLSQKDDKTEK
ncbi:redox-sensing transcriptional repressor Rex [Serpentinicella alkaliphila]|uniref:Redox-sensing transcriptional repressor Rex n=1 Tax=Serpentinicella alkaliphila TaxID=1734049 RepID=A0A4R2T0C5_9FIRM|nr:redox-sensing transcriptional repressor Rex [Serpentinicella alkaliphila]QUH24878.1 redox-sensing transcriptional repressor Rex [Serpentinicella alkaliphila]TCP96297.1 redox-sensing transcriptional repressor [Serpentinicella alkaliphila]